MCSGWSMDNPVTQASLSAERFDLRHPCHTQGREYGDLAAIIGTTNEKPFTNIIPNQPTILTIFPKNLPLVNLKHLVPLGLGGCKQSHVAR